MVTDDHDAPPTQQKSRACSTFPDDRDDQQLLAALLKADPVRTRQLIFADPATLSVLDRELQQRLRSLTPKQWNWATP